MLARKFIDAYKERMINAAQIRAARALLGWTQVQLSEKAGLSEMSIKNLEKGERDARVSTLNKVQQVFEEAGVIFLDSHVNREGGPGLRFGS